jgi:hypothetical protein
MSSVFRDITPYSPLKVNESFGGTCRLHVQRTTRRYIPDDKTPRKHRCEKLKFYKVSESWFCLHPQVKDLLIPEIALFIGPNWVGYLPEDGDQVQSAKRCFK